nr:LssY C-terminal domain-containing protein [Cryobacterium roopkundense]
MLPGRRRADWLAAGTYDRSMGFSLFTLQITHKIDARTDVERDHIVESVTHGNAVVRLTTIRDFSTEYHARNGGGDAIETDGDLPVLDLRLVRPLAGFNALPSDSRDARPGATILGAVLVGGRALVAGALLVTLLLSWQELTTERAPKK